VHEEEFSSSRFPNRHLELVSDVATSIRGQPSFQTSKSPDKAELEIITSPQGHNQDLHSKNLLINPQIISRMDEFFRGVKEDWREGWKTSKGWLKETFVEPVIGLLGLQEGASQRCFLFRIVVYRIYLCNMQSCNHHFLRRVIPATSHHPPANAHKCLLQKICAGKTKSRISCTTLGTEIWQI
jgi:hypothetical protein